MLSYLTVTEKLTILFTAPLPLAALALILTLLVIFPAAILVGKKLNQVYLSSTGLLAFIPAFIISTAEFLLIDNFSYTVFGIGVSTFTGLGRIVHTLIFIALLFFNLKKVKGLLQGDSLIAKYQTAFVYAVIVLLTISSALLFSHQSSTDLRISESLGEVRQVNKSFNNVLIFSSDGIDAAHMSAYGYQRPTTPFIETLLDESLVFENHFTNSAKTTGSVGSLLSGKLPTTTRVIFRPDIFTGIHMFQHLPGYLKQYGFHNGDVSIRHYVDAYDLNMREAFDYANGRNIEDEGLPLPAFFKQKLTSTTSFLQEVNGRISGRLLHIFGITTMYNPFLAVTRLDRDKAHDTDRERMDQLKQFIATTDTPFFINVHLMSTHGGMFPIEQPVFSRGREQEEDWDIDFYDDAILQYDGYTKEIVDFLKQQGLYDSTLLILNSDHGFQWGIDRSLPLIMHYPGEEHRGRVKVNSQRLDIGPTILDYLGLPIPEWMEGQSLTQSTGKLMDPIYIANRMPSTRSHGWRVVENPEPPFYTLGSLHVILCNRIYNLDLQEDVFSMGDIGDHSMPCEADQFPSAGDVHQDLLQHLEAAGYDVSGLQTPR